MLPWKNIFLDTKWTTCPGRLILRQLGSSRPPRPWAHRETAIENRWMDVEYVGQTFFVKKKTNKKQRKINWNPNVSVISPNAHLLLPVTLHWSGHWLLQTWFGPKQNPNDWSFFPLPVWFITCWCLRFFFFLWSKTVKVFWTICVSLTFANSILSTIF